MKIKNCIKIEQETEQNYIKDEQQAK